MFHFFWSRHAFLVEPPHLQPPRPILPLSLSLFSFSLQFSPLVAANISPLGLVLARQPLAAIEAAMMGRQRSRKQRRSQLRSSSLIDLVRVFFSIFGRVVLIYQCTKSQFPERLCLGTKWAYANHQKIIRWNDQSLQVFEHCLVLHWKGRCTVILSKQYIHFVDTILSEIYNTCII